MKKMLKKVCQKYGGAIAALALMVTSMNVNAACAWLMHQPELPKGAEKLKK